MKKILTVVLFIILAACTTVTRQEPQEQFERHKESKKNTYLVDMCDPSNMPKFKLRPKLTSRELEFLNEAQMDARIQEHIKALDKHIDALENTIVQTRRRVELCR